MNLKDLMDRMLDDVTYLRDYGTISEQLWDAYYYLWFHGAVRFGSHLLPESLETIQANLSPDDLLTFQAYLARLVIDNPGIVL